MKLAQQIQQTSVPVGEVALFSLAQAGFCLKTHTNQTIWIDPYLTDCVERIAGFRRMIPSPVTPDEVQADLVLTTHSHPDHLDVDALPILAKCKSTSFVGAVDCAQAFCECEITPDRQTILRPGDCAVVGDVEIHAVFADHGTLAPEAIGFLLVISGVRIYIAGDTAAAPAQILATLPLPVDIMIAPINGEFGNLDAHQACVLAQHINPKVLIGSHFWMFVEHGGDPAAFLTAATELLPDTPAVVMAPGEYLRYGSSCGIIA